MTELDETQALLAELVAYPTVSSDSNLAITELLGNRLEQAGARVELMRDATGQKANLYATLGPEAPDGILLSGHTDVVPVADQDWSSDPFQMSARDGKLYGRGTADMKGFVAAAVVMAPVFQARMRTRPVHFAFTYDEEVGCFGAQNLVAHLAERQIVPRLAIVGEPTEMRIIDGHKGCNEYSTSFHGDAGHGAQPEHGASAVEFAARYVARLVALKAILRARAPAGSRFDPPWTTINVGRCWGGVATNVIAPHAQVDWEMRPVTEEDARFVKAELARLVSEELLPEMRAADPTARIKTEVIAEIAGLAPTEPNAARALVARLTGANGSDLVSFGTEAGLFQGLGMDVVVCGPGSIAQAHKPDEFLALDQLAKALAMLDGLSQQL